MLPPCASFGRDVWLADLVPIFPDVVAIAIPDFPFEVSCIDTARNILQDICNFMDGFTFECRIACIKFHSKHAAPSLRLVGRGVWLVRQSQFL